MQNSIETRGNLCTGLGPPVVVLAVAKTKLRHLVNYHCTDLDITFTVGHFFIVKDSVTQGLRSWVICKLLCAGCNASYICETSRHFSTRVHEHLVSDKASRVYQHIASSQACRESCSMECFTILDTTASGFQLKIKDAMYVKWEKLGYSKSAGSFAVILVVSFSLLIVLL